MARNEIVLREANPADEPEILELLSLCLGDTGPIPRSREYWHWKHHANPFGPSRALVAEADSRLVGLRIFMRWTWTTAGERIPSVRAVDTATHPDWQGKGIFTRLTSRLVDEIESEGVPLIFNTPNSRSRPGYIKMGWSSAGRVSVWVYPKRPWAALRGIKKLEPPEGEGVGSGPDCPSGNAVEDLVRDSELDNLLTNHIRADSRLSTLKTPQYIRWRYQEIPRFEYRATWDRKKEAKALVIWRLRSRGRMLELRLCELIVGSNRASIGLAKKLLLKLIRTTPADYVVAMGPLRSSEGLAMVSAGLIPFPRVGPSLTIRELGERPAVIPEPRSLASWRFSIGDLELF